MTVRVTVDPGHVPAHDGGGDVHVPAHARLVLDNGITLISMPRDDVPLVAFNAIVRSQNVQIFGDEKKGGTAPIPLYVLRMDVKTAEGGKERRDYMNLCPFVLAPPVY